MIIYYCATSVNDFIIIGTGNTVPTGLCDPGYYCPGGQKASTPADLQCWKGHFCEQGSAIPVQCPNGTYQVNWGQSSCNDCPPGYFCDASAGNVTIIDGELLKKTKKINLVVYMKGPLLFETHNIYFVFLLILQ